MLSARSRRCAFVAVEETAAASSSWNAVGILNRCIFLKVGLFQGDMAVLFCLLYGAVCHPQQRASYTSPAGHRRAPFATMTGHTLQTCIDKLKSRRVLNETPSSFLGRSW